MDETGGERLELPGASLFYRRRGIGPLLLLIQGGAGDADWPEAIIQPLSARFTVVTYDPRGLSRSRLTAPLDRLTLSTHSEDAHRLLKHLGATPASIVSTSRGAMVALDLVSRHAGQVATLIAHEPPLTQLLPPAEATAAEKGQRAIEDAYAAQGARAAMGGFAALLQLDFTDREPDAPPPAPDPEKMGNLDFFLTHDAPAVRKAQLDIEALERAPTRIIPAAGEANPQVFTHRATALLAERLKARLELFPGGHASVATHPRGFARRVLELLA